MPDSTFEAAFSELAHANLRDKAPGLMEYLVGFQLLDKNDEDTHAVGVFGFKVGGQWFYAPMFFMNGALKGTDILYVRDQDLFVPLQDNWVNYLLSRRPRGLGATEEHTEPELNLQSPDFRVFSESPQNTKWSSVRRGITVEKIASWARPFLYVYKEIIENGFAKYASVKLDLAEAIKKQPALAGSLAKTMAGNIKFAEAIMQFYDAGDLLPHPARVKAAAARARSAGRGRTLTTSGGVLSRLTKKAEDTEDVTEEFGDQMDTAMDVEVYSTDAPAAALAAGESGVFTDDEAERIMRGDVVVKDHREDTSKVYPAELNLSLSNPTETGTYDVLMKDGTFEKCLVSYEPVTIGEGRSAGVCTLVTTDGKVCNIDNRDVFVRSQEQGGNGALRSDNFYDRASSLSSMKAGYAYVAISKTGRTTVPFKYLQSSSANGATSYYVKPLIVVSSTTNRNFYETDAEHTIELSHATSRPESVDWSMCAVTAGGNSDKPVTQEEIEGSKVLLETDKIVSRFSMTGDTTVAPDGCKVYEIGKAYGEDALPVPEPGSLVDVERILVKKAEQVGIFAEGPDYVIRSDSGQQRMRKRAALAHLIKGWGMCEDDARFIVKEAKDRTLTQYYVKRAQGLIDSAPSAPAMPGYESTYDSTVNVPVVEPQSDLETVQGMQPSPGNEDVYDPMADQEVQQAIAAAQAGQKDVFDTSVISGLVNAVNINAIINDFLPDMIKGLDRIGRVLFMFYWHNDQFRERYGKQDLVDLEDSLRNVFSSVGDLVLFLKQKTIEDNPEQAELDIDLSEIA